MMFIGNQIGEVINEMKTITTPTGTARKEGTNPTSPRIPDVRSDSILAMKKAQPIGSKAI